MEPSQFDRVTRWFHSWVAQRSLPCGPLTCQGWNALANDFANSGCVADRHLLTQWAVSYCRIPF